MNSAESIEVPVALGRIDHSSSGRETSSIRCQLSPPKCALVCLADGPECDIVEGDLTGTVIVLAGLRRDIDFKDLARWLRVAAVRLLSKMSRPPTG